MVRPEVLVTGVRAGGLDSIELGSDVTNHPSELFLLWTLFILRNRELELACLILRAEPSVAGVLGLFCCPLLRLSWGVVAGHVLTETDFCQSGDNRFPLQDRTENNLTRLQTDPSEKRGSGQVVCVRAGVRHFRSGFLTS